MSQTNKRLALDALAMVADGGLERVGELIHPDYHDYEAAADRPGGPEGCRQTAAVLRTAFSEIRFDPHDVIAEDDRVVVRLQFSARHVGEFLGMPATGRRVCIQEVHIWRLACGKVIEHWAVRDQIAALRQLGMFTVRARVGSTMVPPSR